MKLVKDYGFKDSLCRNGDGDEWDAATLYKAVEDQNVRAYKFPLKFFNMTNQRFRNVYDVSDMAHHVKRCLDVSFDYPIVICPDGGVIDGYHRIVMAIATERDHVMAYRLKEMPPPDRTETK